MRSAGIDIASIGYAAIALAVDGVPVRAAVWKPPDKKDSDSERLDQFYTWLCWQLGTMKPDAVAVEELAVFLNKKVIRALGKREGVALLAAKRCGAIVVNPPVTQARGVVFGDGTISKDKAWEAIRKMYPEFKFKKKTVGGVDQADALVHALAAPTILERR